MARIRVVFEALKWFSLTRTPDSVKRHLPRFAKWLKADRANLAAYMRVRQEWSRLVLLLCHPPRDLAKRLVVLEQNKIVSRAHREFLWIALGVSILALLLAPVLPASL